MFGWRKLRLGLVPEDGAVHPGILDRVHVIRGLNRCPDVAEAAFAAPHPADPAELYQDPNLLMELVG